MEHKTAARRTPEPARGISLHIGLNNLSDHYDWDGRLKPCENDAKAMAKIVSTVGFTPNPTLLTQEATAKNVTSAVRDAAAQLKPGDIFVCTYSGHGGQVADGNGEEGDEMDETWCLWDRELVDDELYALWGEFERGVRIVLISDSCHSGSVMKARREKVAAAGLTPPRIVKALPEDVAWKTYIDHQALYDGIQAQNPKGDRAHVGASIILLSACQDRQEALAGFPYSLYTAKLLQVWDDPTFVGGYSHFRDAIAKKITPEDEQYPNFATTGLPNPIFERQRPFTI